MTTAFNQVLYFRFCGNSSVVEHNLAKVGVASSSLVSRSTHMAGWQSGHAAACKAVYAGSIPASASSIKMKNKIILVTGSAGFIGASLCKKLLENDYDLIGIDNINDYYDVSLKKERLDILKSHEKFKFYETDIAKNDEIKDIFSKHKPDIVINLAAQAGVRYSLENPEAYVESNLLGFFNILENVKNLKCQRLIFASSSSVYGHSEEIPYKVDGCTDKPVSLYAATKKSNEALAYSYNNIYKIPTIGLRFFTVYGPMGRPDMAYFKFANMIASEEEITIYNEGKMSRDMTYIDDIVDGIISAIGFDKFSNDKSFEIFNLGNNAPISTWDLLNHIENSLGKKAIYKFEESEIEVKKTWADISRSTEYLNYNPSTSFKQGMDNFLDWYKNKYL